MKESLNLTNKIILITGGTGSFGKTIFKKLLKTDVSEIRIFSRDEKKQNDMRDEINDDRVKFFIGDVRDYESVSDSTRNVNYIFHAAALKQVPSCEFYPMEAVKTNILGTENVLKTALINQVEKVVVLSTDKAVYPINAMGISKAMMEKLMLSKFLLNKKAKTIFSATRYGNVLFSRGSVVPLFVNQILSKKELTITDPNMTRFLMTLSESVDLVFYAFQNNESGNIYVQKSPSCTIENLVKSLSIIFNYEPKIKIIGTRHGEKLYESLLSREEMAKAIDQNKFYKIPPDNRDLNYDKYFGKGKIEISNFQEYNSHNTKILNVDEIVELLLKQDFIKNKLYG
tara:strand:- start:588 stop:1613 length:1026 start_codon:yes stop_codon:yes gene_type:complete